MGWGPFVCGVYCGGGMVGGPIAGLNPGGSILVGPGFGVLLRCRVGGVASSAPLLDACGTGRSNGNRTQAVCGHGSGACVRGVWCRRVK